MIGLTDYITDAAWGDLLTVSYVVIDDTYQRLEAAHGAWRQRGTRPTFHDSEVITVAVFIDTIFAGDEVLGLSFLRQYHRDLFPKLPSNGWFNERRCCLGLLINQLRHHRIEHWGLVPPLDAVRVLNSDPLPVCIYARTKANRTLVGREYFGCVSNRRAKLFGLQLYLTATLEQVVDDWLLAPAGPHDSQVLAGTWKTPMT